MLNFPLNATVARKQQYLTLDNGGNPFKVVIEQDNKIVVWAYNHQRKTPYLSFKASQVFIGNSPRNDMTEYSGGYDRDGTSVVLQKVGDEARNEYYFVGTVIFKFRTFAPIIYFTSPVGNNSVPYPWAQDSSGYVYLLIENVVLKSNLPANISNDAKDKIDPYSFYYGHTDNAPRPKEFKAVHPITGKIYDLEWNDDKNALRAWDFISTYNDDTPMYIKQKADLLELGKEAYLATVKNYGNAAGLYNLDIVERISDRQI